MAVGDQSLKALADALAADRPSPGAGAAGDIALALAASCAAKAFAISARHTGMAALTEAAGKARGAAGFALAGAEWDAEDFPALLKAASGAEAPTQALRRDGEAMLALADELKTLLDRHRPDVIPVMAGDLLAAEALLEAFDRIARRNLDDLEPD